MAKKSSVEKNQRRQMLAQRHAVKRTALLKIMKDTNLSFEERDEARRKLEKLPRDSNPNRFRNRCLLTGRPRAYLRKFGLSRLRFRELALNAEIPGVRKASW